MCGGYSGRVSRSIGFMLSSREAKEGGVVVFRGKEGGGVVVFEGG